MWELDDVLDQFNIANLEGLNRFLRFQHEQGCSIGRLLEEYEVPKDAVVFHLSGGGFDVSFLDNPVVHMDDNSGKRPNTKLPRKRQPGVSDGNLVQDESEETFELRDNVSKTESRKDKRDEDGPESSLVKRGKRSQRPQVKGNVKKRKLDHERRRDVNVEAKEGKANGKKKTTPQTSNSSGSPPPPDQDVGKRRGSTCHQCKVKTEPKDLVVCEKCEKLYCVKCIRKWYTDDEDFDTQCALFKKECAHCRNNCTCKSCLRTVGRQEATLELTKEQETVHLRYLLSKLYPFVKELSEFQDEELQVNMLQGNELRRTEMGFDERLFCDQCLTSIFDMHRHCRSCTKDLCLMCCREKRKELTGDAQAPCDVFCPACPRQSLCLMTLKKKGHGVSDLLKHMTSLLEVTEDTNDDESVECRCSEVVLAAANRGSPDDHIYCPTAKDLKDEGLAHFQKHWSRGEPLIVRDVLADTSGLSWKPKVMARSLKDTNFEFLEDTTTVKAIDCLLWRQEELTTFKFFKLYEEGSFRQDGTPALLKLKDWPPGMSFEERLPRHGSEFLCCLPLREYTHPRNGILNLPAKLPENALKFDLGPKTYIASGYRKELENGDSVTKLHCDVSDAVNVLVHACEATKLQENDETTRCGGALWDIFRQQDVPKLEQYLLRHWREFKHFDNQPLEMVRHPIHDQSMYLNACHKQQLKEEFQIEPWTFEQDVGEAVFIPAGCPHQVRNLQSCTKVAIDFVSPENLHECLRLTEEFRKLPHRTVEDKLEVKKLILQAAVDTVKRLQKLT